MIHDPADGVKVIQDKKIVEVVESMIRKQPPPKAEEEDFNSGWNNALWALLDELGLGDDT